MKIKEEITLYNDEIIKVHKAEYLDDYKIKIHFSNNVQQIVDFEAFLRSHKHPDIQKYLDKDFFKKFSILNGNLNWNDFEMIFPISDLLNNSLDHPSE
jgi:hypothetical protein